MVRLWVKVAFPMNKKSKFSSSRFVLLYPNYDLEKVYISLCKDNYIYNRQQNISLLLHGLSISIRYTTENECLVVYPLTLLYDLAFKCNFPMGLRVVVTK